MGDVVVLDSRKVLIEGELTGEKKCVLCVEPIEPEEYFGNDFAHVSCDEARESGYYEMQRR